MKKLVYFDGERQRTITEGKAGANFINIKLGVAEVNYTDGRYVQIYSPFMRLEEDFQVNDSTVDTTLNMLNDINF